MDTWQILAMFRTSQSTSRWIVIATGIPREQDAMGLVDEAMCKGVVTKSHWNMVLKEKPDAVMETIEHADAAVGDVVAI